MKKQIIILGLLFSLCSFARVERQPRFSCQLNRSVSLIIAIEKRQSHYDSIILQTQYFQEKNPQDVVLLQAPQIIDYGHTFIVVSDQGKSGYALIRIQESIEDENDPKNVSYEGVFDINLYEYDKSLKTINTQGTLRKTFCRRMD
jgi:hypothetical protein